MPKALIDFWRECSLSKPPFAHPDDLELLRKKGRCFTQNDATDFESYVAGARFGNATDTRLHLALYPVPYIGDLRNASVFILMLNPGFEYSDYWAENKSTDFRFRLERNLRQEFDCTEYPFLYLDPQFCWHSAFMWWEKKLRKVVQRIAAEKYSNQYRLALQDLSRELACIELLPYHSVSFSEHKLLDELPSVNRARDFFRNCLIPNAHRDKYTVIVTRQTKGWRVPPSDDKLVIYKEAHVRGASLSPSSDGGKAILRHYGIA